MFTSIGRILPDTVGKNGISAPVARARQFEAFTERAAALLPETLNSDFRLMRLRQGLLTVACRSAAVARHLKAAERELLEAMNAIGEARVERLHAVIAPWR